MASRSTNRNKEAGTQAEDFVAREVNGSRTPNAWYDVDHPSGAIIEVKSTQKRLGSGRRGRFRLWKEQHENLRDHGGRYWFLVDGHGQGVRRNVPPEEIDGIIKRENRQWTGSGSHPKEDKQLKIVWTHILDPDSP